MVSPMGGACEHLWAPMSEGSSAETAVFKWTAGTGFRTVILPVGGWIVGCKWTTGGHNGMTIGIGRGWRVIWLNR